MGLKSFLPYGLLLALLMSFPLRVLAQSGGWWVVRAPMPSSRTEVAVVEVGGKLYVIGGESPSGTLHQNESYDPATNSWTAWAPMPTARHGLGAAVVGKSIYVLSGGPQPGGTYSSANEVFTP